VRHWGRNASGVKGISLMAGDHVVGMVVADPQATLLTVCARGYGKRTPFGPNQPAEPGDSASDAELPPEGDEEPIEADESPGATGSASAGETPAGSTASAGETAADSAGEEEESGEGHSSQHSYRTQHRGGKGLRDIKTTDRNGPVIAIVRVDDLDELMMITARGKIQRVRVSDVSIIGRNTQGVRIMSLDDDDALVAVKCVPREEGEEAVSDDEGPTPPNPPADTGQDGKP
jgi:DNA gyrase subunit A